jgi:hypothetical protein
MQLACGRIHRQTSSATSGTWEAEGRVETEREGRERGDKTGVS